MPESTRDMAVRALERISSHEDGCERRYKEGNERFDRMFKFIKEAHEQTDARLANLEGSISTQNLKLAEQKGGRKMAIAIWGGIISILSIIGGFVGAHASK
jgi:hypothetical protein